MAQYFAEEAGLASDLDLFTNIVSDEINLDPPSFLPEQEWDAQHHGLPVNPPVPLDTVTLPGPPHHTGILRPSSQEDWASQRSNITRLYSEEGKTLKQMAEIMESDFRFVAT